MKAHANLTFQFQSYRNRELDVINQHASVSPFFTGLLLYFTILAVCHSFDYGLTYNALLDWFSHWKLSRDVHEVFSIPEFYGLVFLYLVTRISYRARHWKVGSPKSDLPVSEDSEEVIARHVHNGTAYQVPVLSGMELTEEEAAFQEYQQVARANQVGLICFGLFVVMVDFYWVELNQVFPFEALAGVEGTTSLVESKLFFLLVLCIFSFLMGTYNWIYSLSTSDDSFGNKELNRIGHFTFEENVWFGFKLFLLSEVLIFAGFFWGLFFYMLVPSVAIGNSWPPQGLPAMDVFSIPLLNTCLLVSSGMAITWGHIALGKLTHLLSSRAFRLAKE